MIHKKVLLYPFIVCLVSLMCTITVGAYSRLSCAMMIVFNSEISTDGVDVSVLNKFSDYSPLEPNLAIPLAIAVEKGILVGYEDGTLCLDKNVTRAEFSCMIYRAKDYFTPPAKLVTYHDAYTDIADWHRTETVYCIENGFLMGYGDSFGSNDLISGEQVRIVEKRVKYGLTTREKYTMLEVCWSSPLSMSAIAASAYDPALAQLMPEISDDEHEVGYTNPYGNGYVLTDTEQYALFKDLAASKLTDTLEKLGNLNAERLVDSDYRYKIAASPFIGIPLGGKLFGTVTISVNGGDGGTINQIFDEAIADGVMRESIVALAPEYSRWTRDNALDGRGFYAYYGCGYEYFCYQNPNGIPEGLTVGAWYCRTVVVCERFEQGVGGNLHIIYGKPELC